MANRDHKKVSKKEARKLVYDRLVAALADFRKGIKDKKFERKLQRASRLFATDIVKASDKLNGKTEKKGKAAKTVPAIQAQPQLVS